MALRGVVLLSLFATSLLFLHPTAAANDTLPPITSPLWNETCDGVYCGKGSCKVSPNETFPFVCECDAGWKQFHSSDYYYKFTPCVIPNCSLNFSCIHSPAAPPIAAPPPPPANHSIFDPCTWGYCGEGTCAKISTFRHKCVCGDGYANLLNVSAFPCFNQCSLGQDCSKQGIGLSNSSSSPRPSSSSPRPSLSGSGNVTNNAGSGFSENILQSIILGISVAMVPWL